MSLKQSLREQGVELRQFEYDESIELAADFGPREESSVDVVDGTAMVIVDDEQYDFPVPADAEVFMSNGILTIEVNK